jgi:hypothetical protein
MAKTTTKLNAQDRVILFCAATGINHAAVGIVAHAMHSMAIRGFIAHNRERSETRRATLGRIAPALETLVFVGRCTLVPGAVHLCPHLL